jgi:hypothetical protein
VERVYPGTSRDDRMVPTSMTRWSAVLAFSVLVAVLVLPSCSSEPESGKTPRPPEARHEEVTSAVRDLVFVAENALGVKTSAGGYSSSSGDLFIDYMLHSEPSQPDIAVSKLKQELEAMGAESVEAGVIEGSILVDFDRLPIGEYVWEGFIQVYGGHLFGYLNRVSSGG